MGAAKKKLLQRQGASACHDGDVPARSALDLSFHGHAEGKNSQLHSNVLSAVPAAAPVAASLSAAAASSDERLLATPHRCRDREKVRATKSHVPPPGTTTADVVTAITHFEDDVAANMTLQQLLLQRAAPRLGPQPVLLCYPPFLCASQAVASALLPFSADSGASSTALPPSATFFPVRHAQLQKTTPEGEKRRIAEHLDTASRFAASLPHALFEVLGEVSSLSKQPPQQQQRQEQRQPQDEVASGARSSRTRFSRFHAVFTAAAEAALQQMQQCDCCGLAVKQRPEAAPQGNEKKRMVKAKNGGSRTVLAEEKEQKERTETAATTTTPGSPTSVDGALCVIPLLDPSTRCIFITAPKRVCLRCLQILHLPQLLGLSVASVLSSRTSPLSAAVFSQVFSHFARVNDFSLDGDESQHQGSDAGVRLQRAIAAAYGLAALRRRMRWRVKAAFGSSLADFFSHVSPPAESLVADLLESGCSLQASDGSSFHWRGSSQKGTKESNSRSAKNARDLADGVRSKKRKHIASSSGTKPVLLCATGKRKKRRV